MIKFLLTAAILTSSILSAKADGNELLKECSSSTYIEQGFCIGFVDGVISATGDICVPKGVKLGQLVSIVGKFLQENPGLRHYHGADIVAVSVRAIFPCAKKASS